MDRLDVMGITERKLNEIQDFVNEYEWLENHFKKLIEMERVQDHKDFLQATLDEFYLENRRRYNEYKDILNEYENFDESNYASNEGIYEGLVRDRMGGLVWTYTRS